MIRVLQPELHKHLHEMQQQSRCPQQFEALFLWFGIAVVSGWLSYFAGRRLTFARFGDDLTGTGTYRTGRNKLSTRTCKAPIMSLIASLILSYIVLNINN